MSIIDVYTKKEVPTIKSVCLAIAEMHGAQAVYDDKTQGFLVTKSNLAWKMPKNGEVNAKLMGLFLNAFCVGNELFNKDLFTIRDISSTIESYKNSLSEEENKQYNKCFKKYLKIMFPNINKTCKK